MSLTNERAGDGPAKDKDHGCETNTTGAGLKFPSIKFPRETTRRYTPFLVIRYAAGDDGSRPLPAGSVHWESPDVWVVSRLGINQPIPGEDNTLFARVSNLGLQDATGVIVKFWVAIPSLGIASAQLIGRGYANIQSGDTAVVECTTKWVPDLASGGHQCLIVEAFIPAFDPLTAPLDPWDDRHVGQKNEQLVILPPNEFFSTTVQATNGLSIAQELTFEVQAVRRTAVPELLAARARTLPQDLLPPSSGLPLSLQLTDAPSRFTEPSAVFARRLLSQTLQEVAGTAKSCGVPAQITQTAHFKPWENRMVQVTGQVPADARPGQTFSFRIIQRAGRMITGGYTVNIVVAEARRKAEELKTPETR